MTSAQSTAKAANATLSVVGTILQGYRAAARHTGSFIVLLIVWTAVAGGTWYGVEALTHTLSDLRAHYTLAAAIRANAAELVQDAEMLVAGSLIGIVVYRTIILGDAARWDSIWRIGRREMRYLGLAILFSVPAHVGMKAFWIAVHLGMAPVARQLVVAIGIPALRLIAVAAISHLFISIALTPFFVLAFPLVALDAPGGALRRSVRLSRTCRMRLGAIGFLYALPIIPLVYAQFFFAESTTETGAILKSTAATFLSLFAAALEAAVFAVAFQRVTAHSNMGTYDVFD